MNKVVLRQVVVTCFLQKTAEIPEDKCLRGSISMNDEGLRFEETLPVKRTPRNPKLYDGEKLSLVRMANGDFHCHLKTIKGKGIDAAAYAGQVYRELIEALSVISSKE